MEGGKIPDRAANCTDLAKEATHKQRTAILDIKLPTDSKKIDMKRSISILNDQAVDTVDASQSGPVADGGDDNAGAQQLNHPEMKEVFRRALSRLLADDPILHDLHPDLTHQEVAAMLEVEAGRSMLVTVERADGGSWPLRLPRDARLYQLKAALRTHVTLQMHRRGERRPVSWRGVWRRHWLVDAASGTRLTDDNATLHSLGVGHKHRLAFVMRDRDKNSKKVRPQNL